MTRERKQFALQTTEALRCRRGRFGEKNRVGLLRTVGLRVNRRHRDAAVLRMVTDRTAPSQLRANLKFFNEPARLKPQNVVAGTFSWLQRLEKLLHQIATVLNLHSQRHETALLVATTVCLKRRSETVARWRKLVGILPTTIAEVAI